MNPLRIISAISGIVSNKEAVAQRRLGERLTASVGLRWPFGEGEWSEYFEEMFEQEIQKLMSQSVSRLVQIYHQGTPEDPSAYVSSAKAYQAICAINALKKLSEDGPEGKRQSAKEALNQLKEI